VNIVVREFSATQNSVGVEFTALEPEISAGDIFFKELLVEIENTGNVAFVDFEMQVKAHKDDEWAILLTGAAWESVIDPIAYKTGNANTLAAGESILLRIQVGAFYKAQFLTKVGAGEDVEHIYNGDFQYGGAVSGEHPHTFATGWTIGDTWGWNSFSLDIQATHATPDDCAVQVESDQVVPLELGKTYQVTINQKACAQGGLRACLVAGLGTTRTAPGIYTEEIVCAGITDFVLQPVGDYFQGTVDDVSALGVGNTSATVLGRITG